MQKYTIEDIKSFLREKYGYEYLFGKITGRKSIVTAFDDDGYLYNCNIDKMMTKGTKSKIVHKTNPHSIYNINLYLDANTGGEFVCISDNYINNTSELDFIHINCGRKIKAKWINVYRERYTENIGNNKTGLYCEHCTSKKLESTHALVLKQVWLHEHPDTTVEDMSCINPLTNRCLPTDIVNHRLKIAIEVQSWFHDFEYQQMKDNIKKKYWIDRGYSFYQVDQRDYSVLEMIRLFFDYIDTIPNYIDFDYSNKFDDVAAQNLLNESLSVSYVANEMNCSPHIIYDAIYNNRIKYPLEYVNNCYTSVVQLDLNQKYINEYETISKAQKNTGVNGISYVLRNGRNYCGGYYWVKRDEYYSGTYTIKSTRLKNRIA